MAEKPIGIPCSHTSVDLYKNGLSFVTCIWDVASGKDMEGEMLLTGIIPSVLVETLSISSLADASQISIRCAEIYDTTPVRDNMLKCLIGKELFLFHTQPKFAGKDGFSVAYQGMLERFDKENLYIQSTSYGKPSKTLVHIIPRTAVNSLYTLSLANSELLRPSLLALVTKRGASGFKVEASYVSTEFGYGYSHTLVLNEACTLMSWTCNATLHSPNNCDLIKTKMRLLNSDLYVPEHMLRPRNGDFSSYDPAPRTRANKPKVYASQSRSLEKRSMAYESDAARETFSELSEMDVAIASAPNRGIDTPVELPFFENISAGTYPKNLTVGTVQNIPCSLFYFFSHNTLGTTNFEPSHKVVQLLSKDLNTNFKSFLMPGTIMAMRRTGKDEKSWSREQVGVTEFTFNPYDYNVMDIDFGQDSGVLGKRYIEFHQKVQESIVLEQHIITIQNNKAEDVVVLIQDKFRSSTWTAVNTADDNVTMEAYTARKSSDPILWDLGETRKKAKARSTTVFKFTVQYKA